ncbi:MAG: magnesium transporter CorA family protein [Leptospiraceae bacterium]|nr:magnesium transporter CorA family protein [Leptospiraceae bacterium]MCK6381766.1 magnesium transporter CorA family protein [Leptospiraceae bacterium]NUM41900.1 magnesium transporter CorA family protein [Leptospiraceae bacterium]
MIQHYSIEESGILESKDGQKQFIVFLSPGEKEIRKIQEDFFLDEYDLSSTLDADEVPRLEVSSSRTLIIWKIPKTTKVTEVVELGVLSVGLVLTDDKLCFIFEEGDISFSAREFRQLNDVRDVILGFLLHTIRHYVGHLRVIKQLSRELERKITVSMENRHLLQMFALSESLVYYLDAIEGNGAVLRKFRSVINGLGFDSKQIQFLDDIIQENAQATRQANIYSSVISGLMDARGTIVNNNMNVLLKNLTLINTVFLPLNLIASIWGMSEWSIITKDLDWKISYTLFFSGMGVFGWLTWWVMKRIIDKGREE